MGVEGTYDMAEKEARRVKRVGAEGGGLKGCFGEYRGRHEMRQ